MCNSTIKNNALHTSTCMVIYTPRQSTGIQVDAYLYTCIYQVRLQKGLMILYILENYIYTRQKEEWKSNVNLYTLKKIEHVHDRIK